MPASMSACCWTPPGSGRRKRCRSAARLFGRTRWRRRRPGSPGGSQRSRPRSRPHGARGREGRLARLDGEPRAEPWLGGNRRISPRSSAGSAPGARARGAPTRLRPAGRGARSDLRGRCPWSTRCRSHPSRRSPPTTAARPRRGRRTPRGFRGCRRATPPPRHRGGREGAAPRRAGGLAGRPARPRSRDPGARRPRRLRRRALGGDRSARARARLDGCLRRTQPAHALVRLGHSRAARPGAGRYRPSRRAAEADPPTGEGPRFGPRCGAGPRRSNRGAGGVGRSGAVAAAGGARPRRKARGIRLDGLGPRRSGARARKSTGGRRQSEPVAGQLGMRTPIASAAARGTRFGVSPVRVSAPVNTAPAEIAARVVASSPARVAGSPPARSKKTRWVGALSRKLESTPVVQKYVRSTARPAGSLTSATTGARRPPVPPSSEPLARIAGRVPKGRGKFTRHSIRRGSSTPGAGGRVSRAASRESIGQEIAGNGRALDSTGARGCRVGRKIGSPRKKPARSGGSSSGVAPPSGSGEEKSTRWARRRRASVRMHGRIENVAAAVVPPRLASPVSNAEIPTSKTGRPCRRIPPVTVKGVRR